MTMIQGNLDHFLGRNYEKWLNWFWPPLNFDDLRRKSLFKKLKKETIFRLAPDWYGSALYFLLSIKMPFEFR